MQTALVPRLSPCRLCLSNRHHYSKLIFKCIRSTTSALSHPAYSRSMSTSSYSFTLKDLKASQWGDNEMADTAFSMKRTGFHRWGFVIYRTTYDDDAAWERYLEVLKLTARQSLEWSGSDVLLEQYMDCKWTLLGHLPIRLTPSGPVISDPVGLSGASKADVRQHFRSWREGRSVERDGPGARKKGVRRLPRFKHCLYVDRKCLDTLSKLPENYRELQGKDFHSNMVAVIIDGGFDETARGSDHGLHPDVEGCTQRYVGWRYEELDLLVSLYDQLHLEPLSNMEYERPPLVSNGGLSSMPS